MFEISFVCTKHDRYVERSMRLSLKGHAFHVTLSEREREREPLVLLDECCDRSDILSFRINDNVRNTIRK